MRAKYKVKYRDVVLPAIAEEELPRVLRKLELYEDIVNNRAACYICKESLKLETVGAIAMINDAPVLVCDKPSCLGRIALLINKLRHTAPPSIK